jgi:type IV secretion system protein VirD4
MISRQETARPLLTPGEVMQLPPDDELVMVSGSPPIRAKKVRHYEDRELAARILAPPALVPGDEVGGAQGPLGQHSGDWADAVAEPPSDEMDSANAGIRREPELPEHEEIVLQPRIVADEFELIDDEPDDDAQRQRLMQRTFGTVARQVSLDPGDDMRM